jgi:hypothetical protein
MKQIACVYFLHDYERVADRIERANELTTDLSFDWFMNRHYEFLMLMHTQRYEQALRVCRSVMNRSGFTLQGDALMQRWHIFLLYAEFMCGEEPVAVTRDQFLKLAPLYGRDKAGFNLSMIILQVLIEVSGGAIGRAADRIDALRTYRARYLGKGYLGGEKGSGPDAFFRLLTMAQSYGFDPDKARAHGRKLAVQLPNLDFDPTEEAIYVLPFLQMWELMLGVLERGWNMQTEHLRVRAREIVASHKVGRRPVSVNIWAQVYAEEALRPLADVPTE